MDRQDPRGQLLRTLGLRDRTQVVVAAYESGLVRPDSPVTRHDDDWWNFQVDGYGTWLWALERHLIRLSNGDLSPYAAGIETAVRYLVASGTDTCRDWWEENRDQTHVTTLAGVAGGLRAAVRMGSLPSALAAEALAAAEAPHPRREPRAGCGAARLGRHHRGPRPAAARAGLTAPCAGRPRRVAGTLGALRPPAALVARRVPGRGGCRAGVTFD